MRPSYSTVADSLTVEPVPGTHVRKRIGSVSALDAYAARRVSDGNEAVMFECATSMLNTIRDWPSTRGLELTPEALTKGADGTTRVLLQLTDDRFRDVFRALGDDVCAVLESCADARDAIRALHGRLVRWQTFLEKHGPEGLGPEACCGLYGELHVLRETMLPLLGPGVTVDGWRGCKKAHQDFQFRDRALEVKTTRSTTPDHVRISNVQQLDDEGVDDLFLAIVHVHENETAGETLPELVDALRSRFSSPEREQFESGLIEVGFLEVHRKLYERRRYNVIGTKHYKVAEGFPRILRERIPHGVRGVRYEIGVDACRPFEVTEDELLSRLGGVEP